jgi:hypothetical protein
VAGLRPVVEMQFMDFISCGFDQIVNMAATTRYRHGGRAKVPMVVRGPSGAGVRGALFHSQDPEAWFFRVPGLKVVAPATAFDAKGLLKSAVRDDDPVVFFEHKRLYRRIKEELPDGEILVPLGKAATRRSGKDLLVVTYGGALEWTLEPRRSWPREDKVEVEVLDLRHPPALRPAGHPRRRAADQPRDDRPGGPAHGGIAAEIAARMPRRPSTSSTRRWRAWPPRTRRCPTTRRWSRTCCPTPTRSWRGRGRSWPTDPARRRRGRVNGASGYTCQALRGPWVLQELARWPSFLW